MVGTMRINPGHISEFPNGLTVGGTEVKPGAVRTATVVVAASDSLNKEAADFICTGVDDQVEINAALQLGNAHLIGTEFLTSAPIVMDLNGSQFTGNGHSWGNGGTSIRLAAGSDCNMIEIGKDGVHIFFPTIKDLYLNGNASNQASGHGIATVGNGTVSDLMFTNVAIDNMKQDGLHFVANGWLYSLNNVWCEYCDRYGMYHLVGSPRCVNCVFMWNQKGIYGTSRLSLVNCEINHNEQYGVHFSSDGTLNCVNSYFSDNSREGVGSFSDIRFSDVNNSRSIIHGTEFNGNSQSAHALSIGATSDYIDFYGNIIYDHTAGAVSEGAQNANGSVHHNTGWVTESSGTDVIGAAATTKAVTHGLAVTPVAGDITIVPIGAWGAVTQFYISAYASDTFTVTVDQVPGAPTFQFAWKAIVL